MEGGQQCTPSRMMISPGDLIANDVAKEAVILVDARLRAAIRRRRVRETPRDPLGSGSPARPTE